MFAIIILAVAIVVIAILIIRQGYQQAIREAKFDYNLKEVEWKNTLEKYKETSLLSPEALDAIKGRIISEKNQAKELQTKFESELEKMNKQNQRLQSKVDEQRSDIISYQSMVATSNSALKKVTKELEDLKKAINAKAKEAKSLIKKQKKAQASGSSPINTNTSSDSGTDLLTGLLVYNMLTDDSSSQSQQSSDYSGGGGSFSGAGASDSYDSNSSSGYSSSDSYSSSSSYESSSSSYDSSSSSYDSGSSSSDSGGGGGGGD